MSSRRLVGRILGSRVPTGIEDLPAPVYHHATGRDETRLGGEIRTIAGGPRRRGRGLCLGHRFSGHVKGKPRHRGPLTAVGR